MSCINDICAVRCVSFATELIMKQTWILERNVFCEGKHPFEDVLKELGHEVFIYDENFQIKDITCSSTKRNVQFHGSLNVATTLLGVDGFPLCDVSNFNAKEFSEMLGLMSLNHFQYEYLDDLIRDAKIIATDIGAKELFVRPASPLKEFSGRVINVDDISLQSFDYGVYFDDARLEVAISRVKKIMNEWRFVVVDDIVTAVSKLENVKNRTYAVTSLHDAPTDFAIRASQRIQTFNRAYVLDVCQACVDGMNGLYVTELNPFEGSDVSACDVRAIIESFSRDV